MVVAVSGLAVTSDVQAQQATPRVTIAARHSTALQGIDPLVFDVTRSGAVIQSLDVSVTVASGIISERKLTRTVTIPAGEATGTLSVPTDDLASGAATGDVAATVDNGDDYDVGDPSSASVRLYVGDPLVTVRFSEESYSVDEGDGVVTRSRLIARTAASVPAPSSAIPLAVGFRAGTATSPEDYTSDLLLLDLLGGWTADGDTFVTSSTVPVTIVDDTEVEDDETLSMHLVRLRDLADTVALVEADGIGTECPALVGCSATVTIRDDEPPSEDQELDSTDVTIGARHHTALQGIDDMVFIVTRSSASENDLDVPVTLSPGIIDEDRLSYTVTIGANETRAVLRVGTTTLDPNAATGDVTATVGDGDGYEVGDPSAATVRLHVGETLVTVRFSAASYALGEDVGTTTDQIKLIVQTAPGVPIPVSRIPVSINSGADTAMSPDDFAVLSEQLGLPRTSADWAFIAGGNAFAAEVPVPLTIVDDEGVEDDEVLKLTLGQSPGHPSTVDFVPADETAPPCSDGECAVTVILLDNDVELIDPVVVTLVHVPDGTVIPDDSTVGVGGTVVDGTTFSEDERVFFRLLFSAGDGGPAPGGADVELSFEWTHFSPIVPTSGQASRSVLSLYRVDHWDSAVQILDNDIGNPDGTLTMRITGCERNGCMIGTPSEITVTIVDDDGGPAAAPPGPPETPRLVCASAGGGYDPTGAAASWQTPTFVGGAPISGYEVQYRQRIAGGDPWVWDGWQAWPHTGTATSTAITGLDADSLYEVRMRAVNANGPGQWSLPNAFSTGYSQDLCEIIDELTPSN